MRWPKAVMWSLLEENRAIRPRTTPPTACKSPKRSKLRRQRRWNGGDSGGTDGLEASGMTDSAAPASGE
jgi:hypothetical protein